MSVRKHERPASRPCDWCKTDFTPKTYRNRFCSPPCTSASGNSLLRYDGGSCKQCGITFRSRTPGKPYCSQKCYIDSPQFLEMVHRNLVGLNPTLGTNRVCPGCGSEYTRKRRSRFCANTCRRKYFAERFDRWVANPEGVSLPQNYDEFMNRNDLACPIAGCEWSGKSLGFHVNMTHGITASEFKELCGFNKTTGLVGLATSETLSDRNKSRIESGELQVFQPGHAPFCAAHNGRVVSLEAREHHRKTVADLPKFKDVYTKCLRCKVVDVQQPTLGRRLYCSTRCRSQQYYRPKPDTPPEEMLTCANCAKPFSPSSNQKRKAATAPVCCSISCRNRVNSQKPRKNGTNRTTSRG